MGLVIGIVAALLLSLAVCFTVVRAEPPAPKAPQAESAISPSLAEYQRRLAELAVAPPPKKLAFGAMCYKPAAPPDRIDYLCPTCGTKTVVANPARSRLPWELEACRRAVKLVEGLEVRLIETGFCTRCFPDAKPPSLDLEVIHADGTKHVVQGVSAEDITLLDEFLRGKDKHRGGHDSETPLKSHIPRLRELLGLPKEGK